MFSLFSSKKNTSTSFSKYQKQNNASLKRIVDRLDPLSRKKILSVVSEIKPGKSVSNIDIVESAGEKYGYNFKQKAKGFLTPKKQEGLTEEQKRRNMALTRFERLREEENNSYHSNEEELTTFSKIKNRENWAGTSDKPHFAGQINTGSKASISQLSPKSNFKKPGGIKPFGL